MKRNPIELVKLTLKTGGIIEVDEKQNEKRILSELGNPRVAIRKVIKHDRRKRRTRKDISGQVEEKPKRASGPKKSKPTGQKSNSGRRPTKRKLTNSRVKK